MSMNPPSYSSSSERAAAAVASACQSPKRSIQDMRAQIIANASVLHPCYSYSNQKPYNHLEVVVAKYPHQTLYQQGQEIKPSARHLAASHLNGTPASSTCYSCSIANEGKYYTMLIERSRGPDMKNVRVIEKGEPRDTMEEALEWMLERSGVLMHEHTRTQGQRKNDGCVVM